MAPFYMIVLFFVIFYLSVGIHLKKTGVRQDILVHRDRAVLVLQHVLLSHRPNRSF